MVYLVSLLPVLLCPIVMGFMMWFMMRTHPEHQMNGHPHPEHDEAGSTSSGALPQAAHSVSARGTMFRCLNWKVLGGLTAVGLGVWVLAPNVTGILLPLLILAACPLSMLFMMRSIGGSHCSTPVVPANTDGRTGQTADDRLTHLRAEQAVLAHQIAEVEVLPRREAGTGRLADAMGAPHIGRQP